MHGKTTKLLLLVVYVRTNNKMLEEICNILPKSRMIQYTQHCLHVAALELSFIDTVPTLTVTSRSAQCQGKYCLRVFKFLSSNQRSQSRHEELKLERIVWESKFNQKVMRVPPKMSWSSFFYHDYSETNCVRGSRELRCESSDQIRDCDFTMSWAWAYP
jgi:hypothetical protein